MGAFVVVVSLSLVVRVCYWSDFSLMFRGLHYERRRNSAKTAGFSPWSPVALTSPSQNRGGVKVTRRKGRPLEAQSLIEPQNIPTDSAEEPKFKACRRHGEAAGGDGTPSLRRFVAWSPP